MEEDGRLMEAVACFQKMQSELQEDTSMTDERAQWELGKGSKDDVAVAHSQVTLRFPRTMCREARAAGRHRQRVQET